MHSDVKKRRCAWLFDAGDLRRAQLNEANGMRILQMIVLSLLAVAAPITSSGQSALDDIAESHIRANVPESADFASLLIRDLKSYFSTGGTETVQVVYEMLRDGPTQTGIAYPKFYLWVTVTRGSEVVNEGAARVAAIEKKRFEVTHFINAKDIQGNPEEPYKVFPQPVADKIKEKTKQR